MPYAIIIPALKPQRSTLHALTRELRARGFRRILVVDDGSGASYQELFGELEQQGCRVVHHEVNHGRGAALKTGILFARELWPELSGVLCVDANGQHSAADVARVARMARTHPDALVLGTEACLGICSFAPLEAHDIDQLCSAQTGLVALPAAHFERALRCAPDHYDWTEALIEACAQARVPLRSVAVHATRDDARHAASRSLGARLRSFGASLRLIALFWADASADAAPVA